VRTTLCQPRILGCVLILLLASRFPANCAADEIADKSATASESSTAATSQAIAQSFVAAHCLDCHHQGDPAADLALDGVDLRQLDSSAEVWEKVLRQLQSRQMPPPEMPRPSDASYDAVIAALETSLDDRYRQRPVPGRTDTFRRLTRTEYRNAIRDLLALDVDVSAWLPADPASHGFDNVTVGDLSPTLLNRYISAAQRISRLTIGTAQSDPGGDTIRFPPDLTQEGHVEGLPPGTRGGGLIDYHFPRDGQYQIEIRLTRDRNEHVEGLSEPHQLEVLVDRQPLAQFTVKPGGRQDSIDAHLKTRINVTAGSHQLGITFQKKPTALLETKRQPLNARFNFHRHPRTTPAIYQVSITGPYADQGPGQTASRQRIFVCRPTADQDERQCAEKILTQLIQRAYRRPAEPEDLQRPLEFFRQARADGDFEAGIEMALTAILINPNFLFRIELDPSDLPPQTPYRLSDLELASRLSFFLWSSIPDDELLQRAIQGELSERSVLEQQVRRMLADRRAASLVSNFAGQWLYLHNLESITPDARLYPDFDDNLRQAFRQETELLFASILREDRPVLDLLRSDHTFLNERLAKHYEIPHIYGSRFRRVPLDAGSVRGGLLRHGSLLTVTSYATRTSPVIRGHWILKNLLASAPPPPPPDVADLEDNTVSARLPVRERLAIHRANPSCASCHDRMDPLGFALENYDAVGRWRDFEFGVPIDASGGLPDGSQFVGAVGLEQGLLRRPEWFVAAMTEKLLTFAVGRGMELEDGPAIREIVGQSRLEDHRFSALILAIVQSPPFQMRTTR